MKARITVQVCDLCQSYTADVLAEGGIEIPTLTIHYGTGGDVLKSVFICDRCMCTQKLTPQELYRMIDKTRTESQS